MKRYVLCLVSAFAAFSAVATDYYWIGGASGNWADGNNWSLSEDGDAAGTYPGSSGGYYANPEDSAVINTESAVAIDASASVYLLSLTIGADVTLSGGTLFAQQIKGASHALRMKGVSISSYVLGKESSDKIKVAIETDLEICENTFNQFLSPRRSENTYGGKFVLKGALRGSGELNLVVSGSGNQHRGIELRGDVSGFTGVFTDEDASGNANLFYESAADGSQASWTLHSWNRTSYGYFIGDETKAFAFGALNGLIGLSNRSGVTLTIGGRNENCAFSGSLGASSKKNTIVKTGTANLTYSGDYLANVEIQGGSFTVGATASLPSASIKFSGGSLVLAEGVAVDSAAVALSADETSAIVIDDGGNDTSWSTAIPDTVAGGFVKRGGGALTLTAVPAYRGATVIESGKLLVPAGTAIEELTVAEGASLGLYTTTVYNESTEVITISKVNLDDGQTLADLMPNTTALKYEFVSDEATGSVTVKAVRTPLTYVWTGAAEDGLAETLGNWTVSDALPTELPCVLDILHFPTEATVKLSSEMTVREVVVDAHVTLSGAAIASTSVTGRASVTLGDNAGLNAYNERSSTLTIAVPLAVVAAWDQPATVGGYWANVTSGGSTLDLCAVKLTGSGALVFKGVRATILLPGEMADFTGKIKVENDGVQRVQVSVQPGQVSASQVWDVSNYGKTGDENTLFFNGSAQTFTFGALSGSIYNGGSQTICKANILEIGAREDVDSTLAGNFFANNFPSLVRDRSVLIRKVGAGSTLNLSASRVRAYEIVAGILNLTTNAALYTQWDGGEFYTPLAFQGGTLKLSDAVTVDPSQAIQNSTAAISIDTAIDRTWATALAASNVGGLIKKGAGTLTLAEVPLYTGYTRVEEGRLVLPAGTTFAWDISSPVAWSDAVEGATPASYGIGRDGATWVYGVDAWNDPANDVDLANLKTIDLTDVEAIAQGETFVIMTARRILFNGKRITREQLGAIELLLNESVKAFAEAKGYSLRIRGNALVFASRAGLAMVIR